MSHNMHKAIPIHNRFLWFPPGAPRPEGLPSYVWDTRTIQEKTDAKGNKDYHVMDESPIRKFEGTTYCDQRVVVIDLLVVSTDPVYLGKAKKRYGDKLVYAQHEKEWSADCTAFPGCSGWGKTQEDAHADFFVALELWLWARKDAWPLLE